MSDSDANANPPPDADATTDEVTQGWWGLDSDHSAASWRPADTPLLNSLMDVPKWTGEAETFAWQPGYEFNIQGHGRLVSKERRRYTLVGHHGSYLNQIGGHQTLNADYHSTRVQKHRMVNISRSGDGGGLDAPWGRDRLTVKGDANYRLGSRTLMMGGTIERTWNGGVMRLASMEGVVCGGGLARVIAGPSMTLSGMMTGDVYGGIARAAGVRTYLAVLHYRAAKSAAWASGLYLRKATFVIEPIVSVPSGTMPRANVAAKMGRLQKMARKAARGARAAFNASRMVCPVVDIIAGVAALPFAIFGIAMLIKGFFGSASAIKVPPNGPPRVRNRNVGVTKQMWGSITHL